ncbi:MAG: fumarylacetoacetate hydrolase family protein [Chloroflexota bacterium]
MKLLNFSTENNDDWRLGILTERGIVDVASTAFMNQLNVPSTMHEVIELGQDELSSVLDVATKFVDETAVTIGPSVLYPEKIICIGLNYKKHAEEAGAGIPDTPVLFSKFNNSLAGHGEVIPLPSNAQQYDYEVELGVIIGKETRYVSEAEAMDAVFGYCTINDLSVRDLQMRTSQWLLGKTLNKFMPIGPYLVTADDVSDPHNLALSTWVNGEKRQDSNTNDLLFNIPYLIHYISQYFTLQPGDVISTGTPEGVVLGMSPQNWLVSGDEVTVEVEGLGQLTNVMGDES